MRLLLAFLFICLSLTLKSQHDHVCALTDSEINYFLCLNGYTNYNSVIEGQELVNKILKSINIQNANFDIKPCRNIKNAAAIIWDDRRVVLFDDYYLKALNGSDDYWFFLFVFAHEIAHHLNGHTLQQSQSLVDARKQELDCDRFAGSIIKKFNGTKDDIRKSLKKLPHPAQNNSTHPVLVDRIIAALEGYDDILAEEKKIVKNNNAYTEEEYKDKKYSYYLNEARRHKNEYFKTGNKNSLEGIERNYYSAVNIKKSHYLISEFAFFYGYIGDDQKAFELFSECYEIEPNQFDYLLNSYDACQRIKNGDCKQFEKYIEEYNYENLNSISFFQTIYTHYFNKGEELINTNSYTKSEEHYKKAIEVAKYGITKFHDEEDTFTTYHSEGLFNGIGLCYLRLGDYQKADEYLSEAVRINKLHFKKILNIASQKPVFESKIIVYANCCQAKCFNKKYTESIEVGLEIYDFIQKNNIEEYPYYLHYFLGKSLYFSKKLEEAKFHLEKAIAENPADFNIYFHRGRVYFELGELEKAKADWMIACGNGVSVACEIIEKLNQNQSENQPSKNNQNSLETVNDINQLVEIAKRAFQNRQPQEAVKAYTRAIQIAEMSNTDKNVTINIYELRALLFTAYNDKENAFKDINFILKENSNNYIALDLRQKLYTREGKYKLALQDIDKMIEYEILNEYPFQPNSSYNKAIIYDALGEPEKSLAEYKLIIDKAGQQSTNINYSDLLRSFDLATVYNNYGWGLLNQSKIKEAKKYIEKAVELNPTLSYVWGSKGIMHYKLNEHQESITALTKCIEAIELNKNKGISDGNQGPSLSYYYRGLAKIQLGDKNSGCKDLSRAGELGETKAYIEIKKYCN